MDVYDGLVHVGVFSALLDKPLRYMVVKFEVLGPKSHSELESLKNAEYFIITESKGAV